MTLRKVISSYPKSVISKFAQFPCKRMSRSGMNNNSKSILDRMTRSEIGKKYFNSRKLDFCMSIIVEDEVKKITHHVTCLKECSTSIAS